MHRLSKPRLRGGAPPAGGKHKSDTCGVETKDMGAALASRIFAALNSGDCQHARLLLLTSAVPVDDRADPPRGPGGSGPGLFGVCDIGGGSARDVIKRALPLGSKPSVFDVVRFFMPDGFVLEKSRPALPDGAPSDTKPTARCVSMPPAHLTSCQVVCGQALPPAREGMASGFVIMSSSSPRRGCHNPIPCSGPPVITERLQRFVVEVSGAALVLEFSEGGSVAASVEADKSASRSSIRRAMLPLIPLISVPGISDGAPGESVATPKATPRPAPPVSL